MLMLYNTLTGEKEPFIPLKEGKVKAYFCGPTVQDEPHLGHARSFIVFDVLVRYLKFLGYDVFFVRNITDIDDKIIQRAKKEGVTPFEIAERYMREFWKMCEALDLLKPNVEPRATCHIPEIIELVRVLIEKGYAYVTPEGVYYHVPKFKEYGKLSHQSLDKLKAGARIEPGKYKKHPLDFALWKAAKPGEPSWQSPWGPGRPGWHIECSAMSMKYLGETFDIHGGGQDLIFPHHENEIAQSEAATGKEFARYWFHVGLVQFKAEKMSKSLGNVVKVSEALARYDGEVIRYWALRVHYRKPIEFTWSQLDEIEKALDRIYLAIFKAEMLANERPEGDLGDVEEKLKKFETEFKKAMNDDLNTPLAIGVLHKMAEYLAKNAESMNASQIRAFIDTMRRLGWVLGLLQQSLQERIEEKRRRGKDISTIAPPGFVAGSEDRLRALIELIVDVRSELRRRKIYDLADKIRERLKELGIVLEDTKNGTLWRVVK